MAEETSPSSDTEAAKPPPSLMDEKTDFFHAEFANESDRASVILATVMLDEALDALLRARLVENPSGDDPLFDVPNAPFQSFSTKIDLGFRLGLYNRAIARGLHLIRRIRNRFAHRLTGCTFAEGAVVDQVAEACAALGISDVVSGKETRRAFELAGSWAVWLLWSLVRDAERIPEDK